MLSPPRGRQSGGLQIIKKDSRAGVRDAATTSSSLHCTRHWQKSA